MKLLKVCVVGLFVLATGSLHAADRTFRIFTVEVNGTKFWMPSVIVVKKGDRVKLEAQTKLEGQSSIHGLWLPDFNIKEQIDNKSKSVEFVADKAGIFSISCHMHPPHVGSQLVVLDGP